MDASDLLINGIPATNVIQEVPTQFVFEFPVPATGTVQVTWAAAHGIHDITVNPKALVTTNWTYRLDPNAMPASVYISEFMARNDSIIRDEEGDYSDWIELYNAGTTAVNMAGWYLTDQTNNLRMWRFPSVTIPANSYLLVFASGKDKTNAAARLHTNFQLAGGGEYLALVDPDLIVASEFSPTFPAQLQDVSYGRDRLNPLITGFFYTPTPNAANSTSGAGVAPEVRFSRPSGTFVSGQPFSLELSTPYAGVEIRYLLITNASGALTNIPTRQFPALHESDFDFGGDRGAGADLPARYVPGGAADRVLYPDRWKCGDQQFGYPDGAVVQLRSGGGAEHVRTTTGRNDDLRTNQRQDLSHQSPGDDGTDGDAPAWFEHAWLRQGQFCHGNLQRIQ